MRSSWWPVVLFAAAACGRLSFDSLDDAASTTRDACTETACIESTFTVDVTSSDNATFNSHGLAVQPDGKLLVVGQAQGVSDRDAFVVRLLDDGSFDPSFGNAGVALFDAAGPNDSAIAVALDASGRILTGGVSGPLSFVARVSSTGVLDTTFGGTGYAKPAFGTNGVVATNGVAVDSAGRVLVGGQGSFAVGGFSWTTGCLTASTGAADPGFDSDGVLVSDLFGSDEFGSLAAIGAGDTIYMVGETVNGAAGFDGVVMRLLPSGARDPAFGTNGVVTLDIGGGAQRWFGLALDSQARIVVAGTNNDEDFLLARYSSAGVLDASFGTAGTTIVNQDPAERLRVVLVLPDGRIVAGGNAGTGTESRLLVLSPDGAILGVRTLGPGTTSVADLKLDSAGRVLALGAYAGATSDLYVARIVVP